MRFDQFDIDEYRNVLLYAIHENNHGDYPFYIQNVILEKKFEGVIHRHSYFQIYYVKKGRLRHRIHDQEFELIKGDLFVIPPYVPHTVSACDDVSCEAYEIEFKPEFINQHFGGNGDVQSFMDFMYIEPFMVVRPKMSLSGKSEIDVESLLSEFLREFHEKKPGFELMIKSIVLRLLAMLGRETAYQEQTRKDSLADKQRESVQRVIDYIEEHYAEKIYLEDAVKVSLLCQSYFCAVFKSMTNKSFNRYLNEIRVSKAKEYLKKTNIKMIDICSKTGFENVTHFNRTFKQLTSMTPNEYKQIYRYEGTVQKA